MKLRELHEAVSKKLTVGSLNIRYDGTGDFDFDDCDVTSLGGSPAKVSGNFNCQNNKLTSLVGCPKEVGGDFTCYSNELKSLKDGPKIVRGDYYCDNNKLTSLVGCPNKILGNFSCSNNSLTDLIGGPEEVEGSFYCVWNEISDFKGFPKIIGGSMCLNSNKKLTSLEGIHLAIKSIGGGGNKILNSAQFRECPIKSHVLGLLLIDNLMKVELGNKKVEKIINKYLKGSRDVIDCQNELMDAGLDEYAQL